jgi:3-oxoadipate enol-lactonase
MPETLVFSNSLGTTLGMWKHQIENFSKYYNLLLSDTRGHGQSETTPGEYKVELLGHDVLELTQALDISSFHFCGLSMGGLIGQWLAINGGKRVKKVVLCNTAVKIGSKEAWNERIETVKKKGLEAVASTTPNKWFTKDFIESNTQQVNEIIQEFSKNSFNGYNANCAMVRDADFRDTIHKTDKKILIVTGSEDRVTTVEHGRILQNEINNSELVSINASHLSAFENPTEFNKPVLEFLNQQEN